MNYELLYYLEDTGYNLNGFGWLALVFLIFFLIAIKLSINEHKKNHQAVNVSMVTILLFFIIIFLGLISYGDYSKYKNLMHIIDSKSYIVIEGKVESYDPMYVFDKKHESFIVNGIKFDYRPAYNTGAFSLIKGEGNPIENGDLVRLWYFQKKGSRTNLILKFEYNHQKAKLKDVK